MTNPFRDLPSVNEVLAEPVLEELTARHGHDQAVAAVRVELAELRQLLQEGEALDGQTTAGAVAGRVAVRLAREQQPKLRTVINATGIVLHTNLGRAPLAEEAARAAYEAARGFLNLEIDLETGERSSRQIAIRDWVCRLTGAASATAVNNCAAATVLVLRALARGKEVIVSRGQLVEIGGSFRIPEIMAVSGAILREVGTTNITRAADYEAAIGPNTALLMRIHQSNFRIHGFTETPSLPDLVALGRKHHLPVIDDIGSGALVDFAAYGLPGEPVARDSIAAGADLVLFSGDKLLGGPQAGIIAGRKELIQQVERDPFMRAIRPDKMTLAALEATLRLYLNPDRTRDAVPTLRLLTMSLKELRKRSEDFVGQLWMLPGLKSARTKAEKTFAGGGSLPDQEIETIVIEIEPADLDVEAIANRLRTGCPAVLGRVQDNRLLLDLRTVFPEQQTDLVNALGWALKQ